MGVLENVFNTVESRTVDPATFSLHKYVVGKSLGVLKFGHSENVTKISNNLTLDLTIY